MRERTPGAAPQDNFPDPPPPRGSTIPGTAALMAADVARQRRPGLNGRGGMCRRGSTGSAAHTGPQIDDRWRRWWPRVVLLACLLVATYPLWRWARLMIVDGAVLDAWCGERATMPPPTKAQARPSRLAEKGGPAAMPGTETPRQLSDKGRRDVGPRAQAP